MKEVMQGWRFAVSAARIIDESASSEDCKHTSGGVFVAIDSHFGAVIDKEEGAVGSILGNEGRIAQAWVNVRRGMLFSPCTFWHSEGWTPRKEALMGAVVKQARTTRHLWVVAGDAKMNPEDAKKSFWFKEMCMFREAPEEGMSTW